MKIKAGFLAAAPPSVPITYVRPILYNMGCSSRSITFS